MDSNYRHGLELIDMSEFAKWYRPVSREKMLRDYNHGIISFDFDGDVVITSECDAEEIKKIASVYIDSQNTDGLNRLSLALNRSESVIEKADHSAVDFAGMGSLAVFSHLHKGKYKSPSSLIFPPYLITNSSELKDIIRVSRYSENDRTLTESAFSMVYSSKDEMLEDHLRYLVDSKELEALKGHHLMPKKFFKSVAKS